MPYVYILRCADDTFYVGRTDDLAAREKTHNDGNGAAYTAHRRPVQMVYAEEHVSLASAVKREQQIKSWTKQKKAALVGADSRSLKGHAQNRLMHERPTFGWSDFARLLRGIRNQ
jgi:putative endonuclease